MIKMNRASLIITLLSLAAFSCTNQESDKKDNIEVEQLRLEIDSLENALIGNKKIMKNQMIRSLTFQDGNAENAMNFYVELFDNSKVINVTRWGKEQPDMEGKIMQATFELDGSTFMCSDSPPIHDWNFTPAVSMFIECENEEEIKRLNTKLSEKGKVMMSIDYDYGFSKKFGFVQDQFGVSWQLNLN